MVQCWWAWMLVMACCLIMPSGIYSQITKETNTVSLQAQAQSPPGEKTPDLSAVAQLIIRRTNDLRQAEGHPTVEINPKLTEAAQYFATYMARTNKYGHTADGNQPAERAREHGYDYCMVSENIAYQHSSTGFTTEALAQGFFEGWQQSAEHRKNMLDAHATDTGVAVARSDETGYYYAVQMFGRPTSERLEFQIVNRTDAVTQYKLGDRTFTLPPRYTRTHQQCGAAALTFQWPDGAGASPQPERQTIQPEHGERYAIIQKESGEFSVQRE